MGVHNEVWERQRIPEHPSAHIQWKGTDVCMDIYCDCGQQYHIDDSFVYFVKCPYCGSVFMCNPHIELVKLTQEEKERLASEGISTSTDFDVSPSFDELQEHKKQMDKLMESN